MKVSHLFIRNFRNYTQAEIAAGDGIHIIVGQNAQGKTNLLESIWFLSTLSAIRGNRDEDLIQWDADHFHIQGMIQNERESIKLEITYPRQQRKKMTVNGVEKKREGDYIGTLKAVLFSPEDLQMVKGSPQLRRDFLDNQVLQISPAFHYERRQYLKIVTQRNNLLRRGPSFVDDDQLAVWNEQLSDFGARVIFRRLKQMKNLAAAAREIHARLTDDLERLELRYHPTVSLAPDMTLAELKSALLKQLTQTAKEEKRRGVTLVGPHRDDLSFLINGVNVRQFGSQGQQRTVVLSLKMAEAKLIREESGENPVLLLDDVMSELDSTRREFLLKEWGTGAQTFITSTHLAYFRPETLSAARIYRVNAGQIAKEGFPCSSTLEEM